MGRALAAELVKLKRTKLLLWSVVVVLVGPIMSNPFGTADNTWFETVSFEEYLRTGSMALGTWYGILLFGLLASYLFGREYADGVAPNLLTTPTRRECVVFAKLIILAGWVFALAVLSVGAECVWGTGLGVHGLTWASAWSALGDNLTIALIIYLTLPVVAFIAVATRGILAPMIFSAFGFAAGMIGGLAGWNGWLPWAMPVAIGGTFFGPIVEPNVVPLDAGSWAIAVGVFVVGLAALTAYVNHADSRD